MFLVNLQDQRGKKKNADFLKSVIARGKFGFLISHMGKSLILLLLLLLLRYHF